jgi:hypothetical protein
MKSSLKNLVSINPGNGSISQGNYLIMDFRKHRQNADKGKTLFYKDMSII